MTSKLERLANILAPGGKAKIARMCGVDPSQVTRWVKCGHVPAQYNDAIRSGIAKHLRPERQESAIRCLIPDECPTCGRRIKQK